MNDVRRSSAVIFHADDEGPKGLLLQGGMRNPERHPGNAASVPSALGKAREDRPTSRLIIHKCCAETSILAIFVRFLIKILEKLSIRLPMVWMNQR